MRIVIEGAGEVGSHLAKMLRSEGNEVLVIDSDQQRISNLSLYIFDNIFHCYIVFCFI